MPERKSNKRVQARSAPGPLALAALGGKSKKTGRGRESAPEPLALAGLRPAPLAAPNVLRSRLRRRIRTGGGNGFGERTCAVAGGNRGLEPRALAALEGKNKNRGRRGGMRAGTARSRGPAARSARGSACAPLAALRAQPNGRRQRVRRKDLRSRRGKSGFGTARSRGAGRKEQEHGGAGGNPRRDRSLPRACGPLRSRL